jgi:hypothetical protein
MKHNRLLWFDSDAFTPSAIIGKVGKQVEFSSHLMINKKKYGRKLIKIQSFGSIMLTTS